MILTCIRWPSFWRCSRFSCTSVMTCSVPSKDKRNDAEIGGGGVVNAFGNWYIHCARRRHCNSFALDLFVMPYILTLSCRCHLTVGYQQKLIGVIHVHVHVYIDVRKWFLPPAKLLIAMSLSYIHCCMSFSWQSDFLFAKRRRLHSSAVVALMRCRGTQSPPWHSMVVVALNRRRGTQSSS